MGWAGGLIAVMVGFVLWVLIGILRQKPDHLTGATFISNRELAKHREDVSPQVSRGFVFAMRDQKGPKQ